jgi:hypothetical protein
MNIVLLTTLIEQSWSADTSSDRKWASKNPALGQCAVTALIVQDYMGHEILWESVTDKEGSQVSHYFNFIDGTIIDLTKKQFSNSVFIGTGAQKLKGFKTTRDYILSFESTENRYLLLSIKVRNLFNNLK